MRTENSDFYWSSLYSLLSILYSLFSILYSLFSVLHSFLSPDHRHVPAHLHHFLVGKFHLGHKNVNALVDGFTV